MPASWPRIPYGEADFKRIRVNKWLYVDKTRFLRPLEQERYALLIRPRRFGKSCWVSVLENYYDRNRKDDFERVFGGTDIGRDPTENRNRYVVLRFDFSVFDDTFETLRESFEEYCESVLYAVLSRNRDLFPEDVRRRVLSPASISGKLNRLFLHTVDHAIRLFVIIDEYDNFANTVLAHYGEDAYESFTHGVGFYRNFFATLKGGTTLSDGGIDRLFITGVSPVTMDDVTSGFNIGTNLSLAPEFNDVVGFTEGEVRRLLRTYRDLGAFNQDIDAAMALMGEWYNGYRFAKAAGGDIYNTDMVLYFLKWSMPNKPPPDELIDVNVHIDYGKLRHLLTVGKQLNGNFDLLRHIIGEGTADANIAPSFPLKRLGERDNFLSLLFYFGLLGIRGAPEGLPRLGVPNQTVSRLMYGYLRDAYQDVGVFAVDPYTLQRLTHEMAFRGAWRQALAFLAKAIREQTSIRDFIDGEKVAQAFVAAYLNLTDHFVVHTEKELGHGYADICLAPLLTRYSGARYGYVIEFKYLRRGEPAGEARIMAALEAAEEQLRRYLADGALARQYPSVQFVGLGVVFHGWEMVSFNAVSTPRT